MLAYHVTEKDSLDSILEEGLVPRTGPRSELLGEKRDSVFLFTSFENMENALYNWLGEVFEEEEEQAGIEIKHVALQVEIGDEFFIDPDDLYEIAYPYVIPPEDITVLDYQVD